MHQLFWLKCLSLYSCCNSNSIYLIVLIMWAMGLLRGVFTRDQITLDNWLLCNNFIVFQSSLDSRTLCTYLKCSKTLSWVQKSWDCLKIWHIFRDRELERQWEGEREGEGRIELEIFTFPLDYIDPDRIFKIYYF